MSGKTNLVEFFKLLRNTSLGIKFNNSKPSDALDEWEKKQKSNKADYEKKYLPEYVEKLDFGKLKDCNSFKKFQQLLNECN